MLRIGTSLSEEYNYSREFTISGLKAGTRYNIVSTAYDADHRKVGSTVMDFTTTGEPINSNSDPYDTTNDSTKLNTPDSVREHIEKKEHNKFILIGGSALKIA